MNKSTRIPPLAPLRFFPANDNLTPVAGGAINTWSFDRGWFYQHVQSYYQLPTSYRQKVDMNDIVGICLDTLAPNIRLSIINCDGDEIADLGSTGPIAALPGNVDGYFGDVYNTYAASFIPSAIPLSPGVYFVLVESLYAAHGDAENTFAVSEAFHVRNAGWPKTMLFTYVNRSNDYDILFEEFLGIFWFRAEMTIEEVDPAVHSTVFEDEAFEVVKQQEEPYRIFTLNVGGQKGVPPWVFDKINRILCCDGIQLDGVSYRKDINAQWSKKTIEGYPLKAGTITLRESKNQINLADNTEPWEWNNSADTSTFRYHDDFHDDFHD